MAKKTRVEIEDLKRQWLEDGCWDIEDTEGFEEHKDELLQFRLEEERKYEEKKKAEEKKIDEKAKELGVKGLYRMVIKHEELLNRHHRAIEELGDGNSHLAYRILQGYEE